MGKLKTFPIARPVFKKKKKNTVFVCTWPSHCGSNKSVGSSVCLSSSPLFFCPFFHFNPILRVIWKIEVFVLCGRLKGLKSIEERDREIRKC